MQTVTYKLANRIDTFASITFSNVSIRNKIIPSKFNPALFKAVRIVVMSPNPYKFNVV